MSATFSDDGLYRYDLLRHTGVLGAPPTSTLVFIGLNPSTATATTDDPTIRRCRNYAAREGCGRMLMLNLFAYRSTDPRALLAVHDPVGPENDWWLRAWCDGRYRVVAAWGAVARPLQPRAAHVVGLLAPYGPLLCLGTTKAGWPRHPLYVRKDAPLVPLLPQ